MAPTRLARSKARGTTLLEAVISITILLIGIVGMLRLQVWGANSDEGGRAHTQALQVAHELLAGLQQLAVDDPLLAEQFTGLVAPAGFGHLLLPDGSLATTPLRVWGDGMALPGVSRDSEFISRGITDSVDGSLPRYQRRWTVWMPTTPISVNSSKVIAVSVTWRERGFPQLREVVLYGSAINAASVSAFTGMTL